MTHRAYIRAAIALAGICAMIPVAVLGGERVTAWIDDVAQALEEWSKRDE